MARQSADPERQRALGGQEESLSLSIHQDRSTHHERFRWVVLAAVLILFVLTACYHYLIYLPQPDRPHRLTVLDDVFALGIVGGVGLVGLIVGRRLLRPFKLVSFAHLEQDVLAIGLGWGVLSLSVLAIGLLHLLYSWLLLAGLVLVLVIFWRDVRQSLTSLVVPAWYRPLRALWPHGLLEWGAAFFILLELVLQSTQALTLPYDQPYGYDLYQYHWAVPELYLFHHEIYGIPGWAHANFPFNSEMLNTLALAAQAPVAALLIQQAFGLLTVMLLAGYLYHESGRLAAWLGAALCLCSPMFTGLLSSGYVELGLCYYAAASLVIALAWLKRRAQSVGPVSIRWIYLSGIFAGFGLGDKYTEAQVVVGIAFLLAGTSVLRIVHFWRRGERRWKMLARWLWLPLAYGSWAGLVLMPWLLKDWAELGNPIYPFIWGGPGWDSARTQVGVISLGHFGPQGPFWQRFLLAFWGLFFDARLPGQDYFLPLNYLLLAALALPLVLLVKQAYRLLQRTPLALQPPAWPGQGWSWGIVISSAYVVWILSGAIVARYAAPWALLLAVPAARVWSHLSQLSLRLRAIRILLPPVVLPILLFLGPLLSAQFWLLDNPVCLLTGHTSLQQWERQHIMDPGYWVMVDYVTTRLPANARLLLVGRGTGYFIEGHDYVGDSGEDWIPYLETEGRTPAGMVALLRQNGFRYLVYEEVTLDYVIQTYGNTYLASFLPAFRQFLASSLVQVWSYQNFHIYQVPSP